MVDKSHNFHYNHSLKGLKRGTGIAIDPLTSGELLLIRHGKPSC